ncbi:MAG: AEC family transporter, partial [Atribacterota bacterium]
MYLILGVMFILIFLGFLLREFRVFQQPAATILNRFVFYISFPCLVFQSLQSSPIERMYWIIPPVAFTLISLVFVGSYFLGMRNLKLSSESSASFAMGAAFGNTAFLGYPFIMALLGEKSLPPAIFFDQMGNFLAV